MPVTRNAGYCDVSLFGYIMEQEILNELVNIKYLLVGILITTGIPMVAIVATRFMGVRFKDRTRSEKFNVVCSQLLEDGEYEELIEYCEKELEKRPNSAFACFNLGRAYFEQKQFHKAKEFFLKTNEIDPSWEKEYTAPFLSKIESQH